MSFKIERGRCKDCDCGKDQLIVNRTHWLCQRRNEERLQKKRGLLKTSSINSFSKKRGKIENSYRKVQDEISRERDLVCDECKSPNVLSFSHLIPRSVRPDLIADKRNIVLHCLDFDGKVGCHSRWEQNDKTMNTYKKNMEVVRELDIQYFNSRTYR